MKKTVLLFALFLSPFLFAAEVPFDPYFWMEEVEGEKALEWSRKETASTTEALKSHPLYPTIYNEALTSFSMASNYDVGNYHEGYYWNQFTNEAHPLGQLRRTTPEEYRKEKPNWEVVVDYDAISQAEGKKWVSDGFEYITQNRVLLSLSPGGSDAIVIREYDFKTKQFVDGGFSLPEGKNNVAVLNENEILAVVDTGPESLASAGYPRQVRLLKRGQDIKDAEIIFEGEKENQGGVYVSVKKDKTRKWIEISKGINFYKRENYVLMPGSNIQKITKPDSATFMGIFENYAYLYLSEPLELNEKTIPLATIARLPWTDKNFDNLEVIYTAPEKVSVRTMNLHEGTFYLETLKDVRSQVLELSPNKNGGWSERVLPFPDMGSITFNIRTHSLEETKDKPAVWLLDYVDFLNPSTQYEVDPKDFTLKKMKSKPAKFDASNMVARQSFATSKDGTQIPYFIVHHKDMKYDGKNPTVLYGYGGFLDALEPFYMGPAGKIWLERGGVFVVANIRGGGEYGPLWHQAALKEKRQNAFDDFIAVGEDLIKHNITTPSHLGITGASNGGLLVGAVMVQRPDLFNATLSQVPLLDMLTYHKLLAGASWMAEYGNPDVPNECEYLLAYSPYQNVIPKKKYPTPLFMTSTKDDRVHPAHARKMALRMKEQGHQVYFIEQEDGGHSGSSSVTAEAESYALEHVYMIKQLFSK